MDCFVAWVQYNDYDHEPENIGVFSSNEKAEEAILDFLRSCNEPALSLEMYDQIMEERPHDRYIFGVNKFRLDEIGEY